MSNKNTRYYYVSGEATSKDGSKHMVTVVGRLVRRRMDVDVTEDVTVDDHGRQRAGRLMYKTKRLKRVLTVGLSICHPEDTFDEQEGVRVAKRRISKGYYIGSIETGDVTMLTGDAIMAELQVKLRHVSEHIDEYLPVESESKA